LAKNQALGVTAENLIHVARLRWRLINSTVNCVGEGQSRTAINTWILEKFID